MTEDDVRDLLTTAVPDLPAPADPVDLVRRRASRVRGTRIAATAAAAVLLVLGVVALIPTAAPSAPAAPMPMPAPGPPKTCFAPDNIPGPNGKGAPGQVVPEGATRVTLCTFTPDTQSARVEWVTTTATTSGDLSPLIDTLNGFDDFEEHRDAHPGVEVLACNLALSRQYQMIFDYPTGGQWSVQFDMNCGTVTGGAVIRYGKVTDALNAFNTRYRASGGDVPPPPWDW
ncbi:hypothetical protein [Actinokineospora diospyrosa]|uniref:Ig-like domain-containing protein n=1 Tax=Actinokineospora diospyrosa TaxID=103728 RepID=A0ABT1IC06_9PSEU|nr:hypothetical protein [Actinokineospora diospyrosa]MCP2270163.1 hypothetical protein [Actinokineospora diospyrosa]